MVYCVGCGETDGVSKATNRRVLWEDENSKVTKAWKDIVSQVRSNCCNDELEEMLGNKAFLCLPCFRAFQSYWDNKKRLLTVVAHALHRTVAQPQCTFEYNRLNTNTCHDKALTSYNVLCVGARLT